MLVLNRQTHENIIIVVPGLAEPIVVSIVDICGDKVRLGFGAPPTVTIDREEVYRAKCEEAALTQRPLGEDQ